MSLISSITNNPLNIRATARDKWIGQVGTYKGFVKFSSIEFGYRAAIIVLRRYITIYKLTSVSSILNRFAPPSENDTQAYIRYVSGFSISGDTFNPNFIVYGDNEQFLTLVKRMAAYESGIEVSTSYISSIIKRFHL